VASVYTTPSSIESFLDRVDILGASLPDNAFSAHKCHHSDRVFFGRGSSPVDFFFLYAKVIKDSRLRLPLDEFSTGVLRALNVAPTQLHPNSWAYIRGFQMLCLGLGLTTTPALFLHYYCTRPGKKVGWLSLVSQNKNRLLDPYTSSYKNFKETFFKIIIREGGYRFVFDGGVPKFPLYWTKKSTRFTIWPRSDFTAEDFLAIGKLEQLPRQIFTRRLIECSSASDPAGAVVGKWFCCRLSTYPSLSDSCLSFADVILSMAPPGGNPLLKGLVAQRQPAKRSLVDKGKRPRVDTSPRAEVVPEDVEPITVVALPIHKRSAPDRESPRHKKKNDKEHKKDRSSRRSPTRLRPPATFGDRAVAMDFLKYDLMVSNRVNVDIDSYEAGPYSAKTSASDLHTTFLELSARALLVGQIMGDELMRRDSVDIEKLKADLENSASSLKSALSANINLAGRNKDLEEKLEQADAEIGMLREKCSVASQKEEQANDRAAELRREVGELEGEVALLKSGREGDSRRIADLERKLGELQDHVIEQHDRGFDLAVRQAAFFYKVSVMRESSTTGKISTKVICFRWQIFRMTATRPTMKKGRLGRAKGSRWRDDHRIHLM